MSKLGVRGKVNWDIGQVKINYTRRELRYIKVNYEQIKF